MNLLTLEKNRLFYYLENIKSENLGFSFSFFLHSLLLILTIGLPNFFERKPIIIPTIIPIEIINFTETSTIIQKENIENNLLKEKQKKIISKKIIDDILFEEKQNNVDEKKFNSSDIQEIKKVEIKEKPKIKINKIEKKEKSKKDIVIREKKEVPINLEKEKIKIDTNQVESLPTKKIKPKLKPKLNPVIEKSEKQPDVEVKAKPTAKPDPEINMASILKDLRNEESTNAIEKIDKKTKKINEVIAEDNEKTINKEAENQAKISIANAIAQQIQQCWIINSGENRKEFKEAQYIVAEAEYKINGSIVQKSVQIIDTNIPDTSILISGVKYALYNCKLNLPAEYHYLWKKNKIRFDHDFLRRKLEQKNMNLFN